MIIGLIIGFLLGSALGISLATFVGSQLAKSNFSAQASTELSQLRSDATAAIRSLEEKIEGAAKPGPKS